MIIMKELSPISLMQVCSIVNSDPEINFVALAVTPFHAFGVDSVVKLMQSKGIQMKGLSLLCKHKITGFSQNEDIFINKASLKYKLVDETGYKKLKDYFFYYYFIFKNIKLARKKNVFYVIGTVPATRIASYLYKYMPNRHIIFIIIDEGVGSYMLTDERKEQPMFKGLTGSLKYLKIRFHEHLMGELFVKRFHDVVWQKLFNETNGTLIRNDEILPYYRQVFADRISCNETKVDKRKIDNSILLCTTAWQRNKIKKNEDLRVLIEFCTCLKNSGISIILKPHPRDSFFRQHAKELYAEVIDDNIPIESICSIARPLSLVSFSSTSLVTAKLFYNIPVFCLSAMLNRSLIDSMYIKEIDEFNRVFGKEICHIHHFGEFEDSIKCIR